MRGYKRTFFGANTIYWIILGIVVLLVGGFFYFEMRRGDEVVFNLDSDTQTSRRFSFSKDIVVEGKNGKDIVVTNMVDQYVFFGDEKKYVYPQKNNKLAIQDFVEPLNSYGGIPGCKVIADVYPGSLEDVYLSTKKQCGDDYECDLYTVEKKRFNTVDWYEIIYYGEYVGSGWPLYVVEKNNKLYNFYFQCNDEQFIDSVLNNFNFI